MQARLGAVLRPHPQGPVEAVRDADGEVLEGVKLVLPFQKAVLTRRKEPNSRGCMPFFLLLFLSLNRFYYRQGMGLRPWLLPSSWLQRHCSAPLSSSWRGWVSSSFSG